MANVRFFKGLKETYLNLATPRNEDALYFCIDTQELFLGDKILSDGARIVPTYDDLPACLCAADGVIYYTADTHNGYMLNQARDGWMQVVYAPITDVNSVPEEDADKVTATVGAVIEAKQELKAYVDEQVSTGGAGTLDGGEI